MPHGFSNQMKLFGGELETYRGEPNDLLIVEGNGSLIGISAVVGRLEN